MSTRASQCIEIMERLVVAFEEARYRSFFRSKPLFGGPWGSGGFSLFSTTWTEGGLDAVFYTVATSDMSAILGSGGTKQEALATSRELLSVVGVPAVLRVSAQTIARRRAAAEEMRRARVEEEARTAAQRSKARSQSARIPRRRRAVFDASGGKCHYCGVTLDLSGKWHVDHRMPKALMGSDDLSNLVAACAPCNLRKGDATDVEFLSRRRGQPDALPALGG